MEGRSSLAHGIAIKSTRERPVLFRRILMEGLKEIDTDGYLPVLGDEFVIALWRVSGPDYAATVALKVIEAVSQPYVLEQKDTDLLIVDDKEFRVKNIR